MANTILHDLELYIEINPETGETINHPILGENLRHALNIDTNNLPANYAPFKRYTHDNANVFIEPVCSYGKVNGVYQDIWSFNPVSDDKKLEIQTQIKNFVANVVSKDMENAKLELSKSQEANNANAAIVWKNYIIDLTLYTFSDYNTPKVPRPPKLDENGNLITVTRPPKSANN